MLASKWFDPVLGVDTHIILVPSPAGPVPTPLPSPFVGMVFDPAGMAFSIGFGAATGGVSFTLVNGLPATNTGTGATNTMTMPHIPAPGPFAKPPSNDADLMFGGLKVTFGGSHVVRLGDIALSCNDPVKLPVSMVLVIPAGPLVLVPRPPSPDVMGMVFALGGKLTAKLISKVAKLGKKLFKALRALQKESKFFTKLSEMLVVKAEGKLSRARSAWNRAVCFLTGHPVDVATGRVVTDHLDIALPGPLPLRFERFYDSSLGWRDGALGFGWASNLDEAVWPERGRVVYRTEDGREVEFGTLDLSDRVLRPGQSLYHAIERLTLRCVGPMQYEVENAAGVVGSFAPANKRLSQGGAARRRAPIVRKRTRAGDQLLYQYDPADRLREVADGAGRRLMLGHDQHGRLLRVDAAGSDGRVVPVARFEHDHSGDLVGATDGAGRTMRYEYVTHLLVKETNRNGLSFYFQYDGLGASARCVRTWGDDGIYDHVITYDVKGRRTLVENSLGQVTLYQMDETNQVVAIRDALGGETKITYDPRTGQKLTETDAAGGETKYSYDRRGNCSRLVGPNGAAVAVEFNEHNQPVHARDAIGGEWQWGYGGRGQLVGRVDPLGQRTQFHWDGPRLVALTDPAGRETRLGYDPDGNIASVRTPDGAESHWSYDSLGRCVTVTDAKGNVQRREHDILGHVVRIFDPDGNTRDLDYDGEGNVIHARDRQRDVRFEYRGMARLAARSEAGTTVRFDYDTEEQLVAINNEHGHVYAFELDALGRVMVERGFDQIRRQYLRDAAGRVKKVIRPAGQISEYAYDPAGRVSAVKHGDGSAEAYAYREDGALLLAKNDAGQIAFERDPLGRVVKEIVGSGHDADWVASRYDALGMRVHVRSSRGLDQQIRRNSVGDVLGLRAATGATGDIWEARFQRDADGLELERTLPGGVRTRWERDALGRPVKHEIWSGSTFKGAWQYQWEANDRLRLVVDAIRGPVRYEHDAAGNLGAAVYADGQVDLRMPDAVGNLFRTQDRSDRKYGPAGQLLESRERDGRLVRYEYDPEGNLARKIETPRSGVGAERTWTYAWNAAGMLGRVVRPDGDEVTFTYDALGRRLTKTFRGRTTRWIWDGNVPLHEWVERAGETAPPRTRLTPEDAILRRAGGAPPQSRAGRPARARSAHARRRARLRRRADHLALRARELRADRQGRRRRAVQHHHRSPRRAPGHVRRRGRRGLVRDDRCLRRPAQRRRQPRGLSVPLARPVRRRGNGPLLQPLPVFGPSVGKVHQRGSDSAAGRARTLLLRNRSNWMDRSARSRGQVWRSPGRQGSEMGQITTRRDRPRPQESLREARRRGGSSNSKRV